MDKVFISNQGVTSRKTQSVFYRNLQNYTIIVKAIYIFCYWNNRISSTRSQEYQNNNKLRLILQHKKRINCTRFFYQSYSYRTFFDIMTCIIFFFRWIIEIIVLNLKKIQKCFFSKSAKLYHDCDIDLNIWLLKWWNSFHEIWRIKKS